MNASDWKAQTGGGAKAAPDLGPLYEFGKKIGWDDVSERNASELQSATKRIYALLRDGQWHSIVEIDKVSGVRDTTRRIRDLRQAGLGIEIETRAIKSDGRTFEYRMKEMKR